MLPTHALPEIISQGKLLKSEELAKFSSDAECAAISLEECLLKKRVVSEEALYKAAAAYFELPFVSLRSRLIPPDILELVPEPTARAHELIPYGKEEGRFKIATTNPEDLETQEFIEKKTGLTMDLAITDPSSVKEALKQYRKSLELEFAQLTHVEEKKVEERSEKELGEQVPVVRMVDALLEHAILQGASDIHIEPGEKSLSVRFRVDGILREASTLPRELAPAIAARIKILAALKLDEHRVPQDGRFKVQIPNYRFSVRVSVFPMFDGEKVVMRLLQEDIKILNLPDLGFEPDQLEIVTRAIKKPHGLILVTGPTGSGKTTTLYACLTLLNKPTVNISTIEDPIEYRIPGINQAQVNPKVGFTFALGLRSLLRQDPNVIMVGEIRDSETGDIAVNAALTGHIVLSTLHTNDALTAIPRLFDLGVPPFLVAQTLSLITAQRLVRRICEHCKIAYQLSRAEIKELEKQFDMKTIEAALARLGFAKQNLGGFFKGAGCARCGNEGYKGRLGIHEVLEITPALSELMYKKAPMPELRAAARAAGFRTLLEDAFSKAASGLTTLSEIIRVTKE